jgi:branched-chain amino acid aminotransferase
MKTPRKPLPADLKFGTVFSEHMVCARFDVDTGWSQADLSAYGKLALDPAASVLHYGQAIFEGLKAFTTADGHVALFRPDRHAERFRRSAERTCMEPVPDALFIDSVTALVRADEAYVPEAPDTSLYVRPTLVATEPFLGVRPARQYLFFVIACPVGPYYAEGFKPVSIWVEQEYVRAAAGGLGTAKVGANYVASLYASERAKDKGYAQVLWTDAVNHRLIEEVGTMNVFIRLKDEVVTPPLHGGTALAGVTRDSVLTLIQEFGLRASERPISIDEVLEAHGNGRLLEIFGTGTGAVISPVGKLGLRDRSIELGAGAGADQKGEAGEVAQRLFDELQGIQRGSRPDRHGWLQYVE